MIDRKVATLFCFNALLDFAKAGAAGGRMHAQG
jgi:hypothetical protein